MNSFCSCMCLCADTSSSVSVISYQVPINRVRLDSFWHRRATALAKDYAARPKGTLQNFTFQGKPNPTGRQGRAILRVQAVQKTASWQAFAATRNPSYWSALADDFRLQVLYLVSLREQRTNSLSLRCTDLVFRALRALEMLPGEPAQLVLWARTRCGNAHLRDRHLRHTDERPHAMMLRYRRRIDRRVLWARCPHCACG
jgi:hypothetical protein